MVTGVKQSPDRLSEFLHQYERYVREVLQPTQREVAKQLQSWLDPPRWEKYKEKNEIPIPSPVKHTSLRIKRPEQVVDKIFRKSSRFRHGLEPESFRTMRDAIGVRALVYVLSHLPLIDQEIRTGGLFDIHETEQPVAYLSSHQAQVLGLDHLRTVEKASGYCSIHYILRLKNSSVPEDRRPWFELQVRTLGQDLWSTMEHHLGYKPGKGTSMAARRQFKILSKLIGAIDEHFNFLYEELNRFQAEVSYEGSDLLTPANLPPVLAEVGIACAQRDINNILKFLYSRGVETVGRMRDIATPDRLDIIRNTYLALTGRPPTNLEVIANLAAMRGAPDSDEEVRRIKAQIEYRGAWDSIRQEFIQE